MWLVSCVIGYGGRARNPPTAPSTRGSVATSAPRRDRRTPGWPRTPSSTRCPGRRAPAGAASGTPPVAALRPRTVAQGMPPMRRRHCCQPPRCATGRRPTRARWRSPSSAPRSRRRAQPGRGVRAPADNPATPPNNARGGPVPRTAGDRCPGCPARMLLRGNR